MHERGDEYSPTGGSRVHRRESTRGLFEQRPLVRQHHLVLLRRLLGPLRLRRRRRLRRLPVERQPGRLAHLSQACWELTRPDLCGESGIPARGCGSVLNVRHQCTGATVRVAIADCGPRTSGFCGEQACCDDTCLTNRVLDLTPAAFSAIGSLDSGLLPVVITE
ncbi:septal ring lytic transglycosylase RlpA family protein [Streptomyces sp. 8K308]|uniref:septal ring lytic transglycosylase RlpA family protein n=1 Tax=Streptomyces sp. 8K308 TaxID=2530388 RepID=UPI001FB843DE|nr:septal ring lytic transglycosylase RlpA family protein [Streptomyces sp. 8K308]